MFDCTSRQQGCVQEQNILHHGQGSPSLRQHPIVRFAIQPVFNKKVRAKAIKLHLVLEVPFRFSLHAIQYDNINNTIII